MNKLIIGVVVSAACVANAAQTLNPCFATNSACDSIVFKLTASGKTVADMGDYKSVKPLKVSKGYLVLNSDSGTGACCYDKVTLLAKVKVQKKTYELAVVDEQLVTWSVFGKNLDKALYGLDAGKSASLETELGFAVGGGSSNAGIINGPATSAVYQFDDNDDITSLEMFAAGFGNMKYSLSKEKKSLCNPGQPCEPTLTWKSYKGWFAGVFDELNPFGACATCQCLGLDLFGGTWSATYAKKFKNTQSVVKSLFGASYEDSYGEWEEPEADE